MLRILSAAVLSALLASILPVRAHAIDPAVWCEAAKLKLAGKHLCCQLNAGSKARKGGSAADFTRCNLKFGPKWQKIEDSAGDGVCPTEADSARISAVSSRHVFEYTGLLSEDAVARRVFVTSSTFKGDLGGLAGADDICQTLADREGLPGTYKAWLSDSTASPSTRFLLSPAPYIRLDGVRIAHDWADLIDGSLAAPINVDEQGTALAGQQPNDVVWTGTQWSGIASLGAGDNYECGDWTSRLSSDYGLPGHYSLTGASWSGSTGYNACDLDRSLYCFQQ